MQISDSGSCATNSKPGFLKEAGLFYGENQNVPCVAVNSVWQSTDANGPNDEDRLLTGTTLNDNPDQKRCTDFLDDSDHAHRRRNLRWNP